ncbi:hypothetical protein [Pseudoalteromonas ruthenica]|uniref:hypothetical protein n=1 Tax=Pseudoalteromonas ruthenica TaxID=151081 RepID=UPI0003475164|nr:hypothetical protein [Pseudoalteromonas ruthenica]
MTHINLKASLLNNTQDFCAQSCVINCPLEQNKVIVDLVFQLASYKEEGSKLHPKLYITTDIINVLKMLPGQASMEIGECSDFSEASRLALKKCAPLAVNGWCIYINELEDKVKYGIFRGDTNPTAVDIDDIILTEELPYKTIKIQQITNGAVQVQANNGSILNISLNHQIGESTSPKNHLDELVRVIVSDVVEHKEQVTNFMSSLLNESIKKSHGCLIVVSKSSSVPSFLEADGTTLNNPIDFQSLVKVSIQMEKEAGSLVSMGHLLDGMLGSDGIVVFSKDARVLAFNCFTPLPTAANSMPLGGARRRAYDSLNDKIGNELEAVYMQSQDGVTEFRG